MDQKEPKRLSEQQIKSLIDKAIMLGCTLIKIPTFCEHECILISTDLYNHIIYIPDDVTHLNQYRGGITFTEHIKELQGHIRVIGGHNLKDTNVMFLGCKVQSLDLSNFDTSKVTDMSCMFADCQAQSIDLSNFDTSNVTDMSDMFLCCKVQSLDLSSFDTSNTTDMGNMFTDCEVQITATDPKILKEYNKSR